MAWFGIVRDDEAIAQWQRADAVRRATSDPRRRVAGRAGQWVGLPLMATIASVLAVVPGTLVPPTEAAPVARVALDGSPVGEDLASIFAPFQDGGADPERERGAESQDARAASPERAFSAAQGAAAVARLRAAAAAKARPAALVEPVGPPSAVNASGIPVTVLAAYRAAEASMAASDPACHLPWWLLAGIGRIESGHASGGRVTADGTTRGRILGPRLDGSLAGTAVIRDTDGGALDGDPVFDRAVGPMQFLPGTWRSWGRDGNADGVKNPSNVYDASLGSGAYLCAGGRDLSTDTGIAAAVLSYNYSRSYLDSVVSWGLAYRDGVTPTNDGQGTVPPPATTGPTTSTPTTARPTTGNPGPTTTTSPTTSPPTTGTSTTGTSTTSPPTTGTSTTSPPTTGPSTTSPPTTTTPSCPGATTGTTPPPTTTTTTITPSDPSCPAPTTSTTTTGTTGATSTTTSATGATSTTTSSAGIVSSTSSGTSGT